MSIHIVTGNEPYIIDKKVSEIKRNINVPEMDLSVHEQLNENCKESIKSLPMFNENRVVILSLDEIKGSDGDELIKIIKKAPATTNLCIVVKNLDKRTVFYKYIKKQKNMLIECNKLKENQLMQFVFAILKEKSAKITNSAYSVLVKRINYFEDADVSLYTVEVFVRQLMYLSSIITDEEVQKVVRESSSEKIYVLTKSILSGEQEKTFSLALDFIDRGENIIGMLSMMLRVFRLSYKASLYKELAKAELGTLLGVPLFQFQDALSVPDELLNLVLDIIQDGINGIKSGHCEAENMFLFVLGKIISLLHPLDNKGYAHY